MMLIPDLREFLELLNSENVQYLLIGGWAYNRYAEPRMTGDIDIFVSASDESELKLRKVLIKFGYMDSLPDPKTKLFRKKILMLGVPPNRIDLISYIDGVTFEEAFKNREEDILDGIKTYFISLEDLIKNKRSSARAKDLADLETLLEITKS